MEPWRTSRKRQVLGKFDNMHGRHVSLGHDNTGKSAQKCYSCTEEGMVQKRACKVTTCWVYNLLGLQMHLRIYNFCWMTRQCEDLTRNMLHAVTTTHKKAMPNTTLEQIQTSITTEMQLCMQNIQYKTTTGVV